MGNRNGIVTNEFSWTRWTRFYTVGGSIGVYRTYRTCRFRPPAHPDCIKKRSERQPKSIGIVRANSWKRGNIIKTYCCETEETSPTSSPGRRNYGCEKEEERRSPDSPSSTSRSCEADRSASGHV